MLYQNLYTRLSTLTLVTVILVAAFAPGLAQAQAPKPESEIRTMLEQRDRDIKKLIGTTGNIPDAKKEELRTLVNGLIDFDAMGEAALGSFWSTITAAEQKEFVRVFGEIVKHQSLADIDVYRSSVTYDLIKASAATPHVTTTTTYKDVPAKVEYDFLLKGNTWRAKDIVIDGVSTVEGYSRSFQSLIRKKGFSALMTSLNKRLEKTKA